VAKATRKKTTQTSGMQPVLLRPEVVGFAEAEPIYSNFAQVRMGPNDISIAFCQIAAPSEAEAPALQKRKQIDARTKAVVILPPSVASGLVKALTTILQQHGRICARTS